MTTSAPACYVLTMPRIAELPPENLTRGWLTEPALARAASFAASSAVLTTFGCG